MPESSRMPVRSSRPNSVATPGTSKWWIVSGLRLPAAGRIFGVQPDLDRMAACVAGGSGGRRLTVGDHQLELDQIQAGGEFGDRVLDLQAGVHLEEVEVTLLVGEELDRARADVADRGRGQAGGLEQPVPHPRNAFDQRRRRLLDDLLVAALDRAFPLADRPHRAVPVGHHLHLDVVAGGRYRSQNTVGSPNADCASRRAAATWSRQFGQFADHAHAASATAGRGLDQHRQLLGGDAGRVEFVEHRYAGGGHHLLGLDLGAHRLRRRRPADRSRPARHRPPPRRTRRSRRGIRSRGGWHRHRMHGRRRSSCADVEVSAGALQPDPDIGLGHVRGLASGSV